MGDALVLEKVLMLLRVKNIGLAIVLDILIFTTQKRSFIGDWGLGIGIKVNLQYIQGPPPFSVCCQKCHNLRVFLRLIKKMQKSLM